MYCCCVDAGGRKSAVDLTLWDAAVRECLEETNDHVDIRSGQWRSFTFTPRLDDAGTPQAITIGATSVFPVLCRLKEATVHPAKGAAPSSGGGEAAADPSSDSRA
jgi:hypothetical protein